MSPLRDALRDLPEDVFFDLLESEQAYLLVVDVPGITPASADLAVEDGRLVVDAMREKDVPGEYRYVAENRPSVVDIDLPLPEDASPDDVDVALDRGVLEVTIPKGRTETTIDVVDVGDETDDEPR